MATRIFNLAKKLKVDTKDALDMCRSLGIPATSVLTALSEEDVKRLVEAFGKTDNPSTIANDIAVDVALVPLAPMPKPMRKPARALDKEPSVVGKEQKMRSGAKRKSGSSTQSDDEEVSAVSIPVPKLHPYPRSSPRAEKCDKGSLRSRYQEPKSGDPRVSLVEALDTTRLHLQVMELCSIVEFLLSHVAERSVKFPSDRTFGELVENAIEKKQLTSVTQEDMAEARRVRNENAHRKSGKVPKPDKQRKSRNTFVLAILDLLEHVDGPTRQEVLADFVRAVREPQEPRDTDAPG